MPECHSRQHLGYTHLTEQGQHSLNMDTISLNRCVKLHLFPQNLAGEAMEENTLKEKFFMLLDLLPPLFIFLLKRTYMSHVV